MPKDLRFKYLRGLHEKQSRDKMLVRRAGQGRALAYANAIVALTLTNEPIMGKSQAEHKLFGVGDTVKDILGSIESDKSISDAVPQGKQPSVIAAALVSLLEHVEQQDVCPSTLVNGADRYPTPKILCPLDQLLPRLLENLEQQICRRIPSGFRVAGQAFVTSMSELTSDVRFQLVHTRVQGKGALIALRKKNKKDHLQLTLAGIKLAKRLRDGQVKQLHVGDLYTHSASSQEGNRLRLLMDLREAGGTQHGLGAFADTLKKLDVCFATRTLKIADYQWELTSSGQKLPVFVERKSYSDLVESLLDGRFENQKMRMLQQANHLRVYLVEGDLDAVSRVFKCRCGHGCLVRCATPPVTIPQVEGLLKKLPEEGFNLVLTKGFRDTLVWLQKMTKAMSTQLVTDNVLTLGGIRQAFSSVSSDSVEKSKAEEDEEEEGVILLSPGSSGGSEGFSSSVQTPNHTQSLAIDLRTPDSADEGETDEGEAPASRRVHKKLNTAERLKKEGFKTENIEFAMEALNSGDVEQLRPWLAENIGKPQSESVPSLTGKARSIPKTSALTALKAEGYTAENIEFAKEVTQSRDADTVRYWLIENVGPPVKALEASATPTRSVFSSSGVASSSREASNAIVSSPVAMPLRCDVCDSLTVNDRGFCWDCARSEALKSSTPASTRKEKKASITAKPAKAGGLDKATEVRQKATASSSSSSSATVVDLLDDSDEDEDMGTAKASQASSTGTPTKPVRAALSTTKKKKRRRNSSLTSTSAKKSPSKPRAPTNAQIIATLRSRGHAIPQGATKDRLIAMLALPAYPEILIKRKEAKRWLPRDRTCMFALLCVFDREKRRGNTVLEKGWVMDQAEHSGILKEGTSMYTQDGIAGGMIHNAYDGWSNMSRAKDGDVPLLVRVKKKRGQDEQYRLSKSTADECGEVVAEALHQWAHSRNYCNCTSHP